MKFLDKILLNYYYKKKKREKIINYYRKIGYKIGDKCNICTRLSTSEPYLLSIGDNCIISYNVDFVTHDASVSVLLNEWHNDLYGRIVIGNNCFIGSNSIIMYGVSLGDNTIVASGSVVTKSFNSGNVVLAGVPAKPICTIEEFRKKNVSKVINTNGLNYNQKKELISNSELVIK